MKPSLTFGKIVIILVIAALVLASVGVLLYQLFTVEMAKAREEQYREEIAPLILRKSKIQTELFEMESEYMADVVCGSNATVVFLDIDAPLYDSIYGMVKEKGQDFVGTLCFSPEELPGLEGRISMAQFNEMIESGWSTAIYWSGEGNLEDYLVNMRSLLSLADIPMPNTLFFEVYSYDDAYDELISEFGITYAVQYGETGRELIDTSVEGEVFHPGVVGWNAYGQQKNYLRAIYESKGCGSYSVSLKPGLNSDAYLDLENGDAFDAFGRMIDYLCENSELELVTCLGYDAAWQNRREYARALSSMDEAVGGRRIALIKEIEEIEQKMLEIKKKYE